VDFQSLEKLGQFFCREYVATLDKREGTNFGSPMDEPRPAGWVVTGKDWGLLLFHKSWFQWEISKLGWLIETVFCLGVMLTSVLTYFRSLAQLFGWANIWLRSVLAPAGQRIFCVARPIPLKSESSGFDPVFRMPHLYECVHRKNMIV